MENLRLLVEKETIVKKTGISVVKSKIFSEKAQIIGRKSRNFKRNLDYQFLTDKPGIIIKKTPSISSISLNYRSKIQVYHSKIQINRRIILVYQTIIQFFFNWLSRFICVKPGVSTPKPRFPGDNPGFRTIMQIFSSIF